LILGFFGKTRYLIHAIIRLIKFVEFEIPDRDDCRRKPRVPSAEFISRGGHLGISLEFRSLMRLKVLQQFLAIGIAKTLPV